MPLPHWFASSDVRCASPSSRNRKRGSSSSTCAREVSEALEARRLLSNIVWVNRGLASDNFADTFGAQAGAARNVVDAVIRHWERVIDDFNWSSGTQYELTVSMRPGTGFGGQCPPNQIVVDGSGAPEAGTILLGRGNDLDLDGNGDGAGWYLDPEPDDFEEFAGTISNAFTARAPAGSPAEAGFDFYTLVSHEMGHAMGMTSASGADWGNVDAWFADDTGIGDTGGAGNVWAWQSPSVGRAVLTDSDLNGAADLPVHTARGGQSFMYNGQQYDSASDFMYNAVYAGNLGAPGQGIRRMISNLVVGMLADVYVYDTVWAEQFGSFYTSLDRGTNTLFIRGGAGSSNDVIRIFRDGTGYSVSVNLGTDVPGTGPTDAFESFWSDSLVSSIVIDAGGGNDTIEVRSLSDSETVVVNAGDGDDVIELAIGDFDDNLLSPVTVNGGSGADEIYINDAVDGPGEDIWTLTTASIAKPGRTVAFSSIDRFEIFASDNSDTFHLEAFSGSRIIVDAQEGNDVFHLAQPLQDLDALQGRMTLIGGLGNDALNLYDRNDTGADDYLFDSSAGDNLNFTKTGTGAFDGLLFAGFPSSRLEANNLSNDIVIEQFFGALTVHGGDGNDAFDVGNGNLQLAVAGDLRLEGGLGDDTLLLDDSADTGADLHSFTGDLFTGRYTKDVIPRTIEFVSIAQATLETGSNQSVNVVVEQTPAGLTDLFINGNNFGPDTLLVGTGTLSLVAAQVHFDGFSDGRIFFNNSAGLGNFYDLNFGTLSGNTFTHTFTNTTLVDITAGPGNDRLEVYNSFGYALNVNMSGGDDDVNIGRGDMIGAGDATVFGGSGEDGLYFDNSAGSAPLTLVADQGAGLPFVDVFNGNVRTVYDSFDLLQVEAGPLGDHLRTIAVPMSTQVRLFGMAGDDQIFIDGHPTLNSSLFLPVQVSVGAGMDAVQVNGDGAGGARALMTTSQSVASLGVFPGGRLTLQQSGQPGGNVLTTRALTATGRIDLTNGGLIYDYDVAANQEAFIAGRIASGFNGGDWAGNGLATSLGDANSFGLGYAQASDVAPGGSFLGQQVDLTAIVVRFTRLGDANLDGLVNLTDFGRLRAGFGDRGFWSNGDFNYDLSVNLSDFGLLRSNFGLSI